MGRGQNTITNMPKLKQMPNTKSQGQFFRPFTASRVIDSHAIISKEELKSKRDKKVPIHITQLYYERQEFESRLSDTKSTEKRKVDLSDNRETKRFKLPQVVCSIFHSMRHDMICLFSPSSLDPSLQVN